MEINHASEACTFSSEKDNSSNELFIHYVNDDTNAPVEAADCNSQLFCNMNDEIDSYEQTTRFTNECRVCGEEESEGIEIFSNRGSELRLKVKLEMHMPISLFSEGTIPQKVCINCCNILETTHNLALKCLQTDIKLRRSLNPEDEPQYDSRFIKLVCLVANDIEDKSYSEKVDAMHLPSLDQDQGNLELDHSEIMSHNSELNDPPLHSLKFPDNSDNEVHADLTTFFQTLPEPEASIETGIVCPECNDTFKTEQMFEDHKILCDVAEDLDLKETSRCDVVNEEMQAITDFQLSMNTCNVCKQVFDSKNLLDEHSMHCEPCTQHVEVSGVPDSSLNDSDALLDPSGIDRTCGYCQTMFETRKELQTHVTEIHAGQSLFKCNICEKAYEKWSSLDIHAATHRTDKPYLCDLCGKSFKHSNNLRGHKRIHLEDSKKKRHVCDICGSAFRSRFHLGEHMNQHKGNKPYACDQCGKAFYKRIQLRQHKLSHGVSKHACPVCGVAFNRRGNMKAHLKRHEKGDGLYTCSVCERQCKSMSELKQHRKQHTDYDIAESVKRTSADKVVYQCKICAKVFSKNTLLRNHERIHVGEKSSVECDECGKKLSSRSSLAYHKKSIHSNERPHMCQFCGEAFVSKDARLIHERIHTGERPYVCKICNMQYRCSSNLSQHMKTHSEIRPHVCSFCNKGFTRKGALTIHERIHTGVKPFSCSDCDRTFSKKNDMIKHMKTHQVKSIQVKQCDEGLTEKIDLDGLVESIQVEPESSIIQSYVIIPQQLGTYTLNISGKITEIEEEPKDL